MKTPRVKGLHSVAKMMYQVLRGTVCVILPLTQQHSQSSTYYSIRSVQPHYTVNVSTRKIKNFVQKVKITSKRSKKLQRLISSLSSPKAACKVETFKVQYNNDRINLFFL